MSKSINIKKIIANILIVLILLMLSLEMIYHYYANISYLQINIIFSLLIVVLECVYLVLFNHSKINKWAFYLFLFVIYQVMISIITKSTYFPKFYTDLFGWPLAILVFSDYFSKYDLSEKMGYVILIFLFLFVFISFYSIRKYLTRAGDYGGVIFYSTYSCITLLPLTLMTVKNPVIRKICILLVSMISLLSTKRGNLIALVFGIIFYILVDIKVESNNKIKYKKMFKYIVLFILTIIFAYILVEYSNLGIFVKLRKLSTDGGSDRLLIWQFIIQKHKESSFLRRVFGHGFQSVYWVLKPLNITRFAHNSYIEYLYDYGYVGFIGLITFVVSLFKKLSTMIKDKFALSSYMVFTLIITVVFSLFSYLFEQSLVIMPIALTWGICIGRYNYNINNKKIGD